MAALDIYTDFANYLIIFIIKISKALKPTFQETRKLMQVKQITNNKQSKLTNYNLGARQPRKYSEATETEVVCKIPKVCKHRAPRMMKAFPAIEIQKTEADNQSAFSEFETTCASH